MLSESERALAIREGHRNAADAAYFNERPHLADDNGIRVFDAGFDRGWDAACAERDARIAELEKWQAEHWNAFEIINNYFVSKDLLLVVEDGGPAAAARNIVHSVAALEQQLAEARKVLKETGLLLHHFWCDVQMNDYSFDKLNKGIGAIDAAIKEQT